MQISWREAFKRKRFVVEFIMAVVGLVAFLTSLPYYFINILLPKPGVPLNDPVLNFFTPRDWSIEIFVIIYLCTIASLVSNRAKPKALLIGMQTYVAVNFLRLISLYLVTLEAPEGIIPLSDPFLTVFAYGQPVYVKDLFFSGHISTLCVWYLIEQRKFLKTLMLVSTIAVAVFLAWQRVHYSLDMIVAPIITWVIFKFFERNFSLQFEKIGITPSKV